MSRERANYPERPLRKGRPKSSTTGGRKSKVWTSACTEIKGGVDVSPRLNVGWHQSPMYKAARLARRRSLGLG